MRVNIKAGFGEEINTRKFGGKVYHLYDIPYTRREADQLARKLRGKGYPARVVAYKKRWLVYRG